MTFIKDISFKDSTDTELLEKYKQTNNMQVLSALYQRHMELVYGVCLKYFKEQERSKDAVMSIFEELVQKLQVHEVSNFKSWLHTLTKNYCLMQLRTPKNLKTTEFNPDYMQSVETVHLNGMLEKEEQFSKLGKCLDTLSPQQKETIELFYLKQKCYEEIVEITGHDWNKVRSYIQNGRRNLKICMDKEDE
ncbi:RNA polymerase sigma factor [Terrimonas sp.]|uniref:RNA polymerase sigma factor n=1 Tax=Terrimonas sp. TaxID=1914338 RepID=UPI001F0C5017|nr:sigma-70 family RNA polymerase sigma factor [Terrimonas sp.]